MGGGGGAVRCKGREVRGLVREDTADLAGLVAIADAAGATRAAEKGTALVTCVANLQWQASAVCLNRKCSEYRAFVYRKRRVLFA